MKLEDLAKSWEAAASASSSHSAAGAFYKCVGELRDFAAALPRHKGVPVADPFTNAGIAELVRTMGARLGTALRMVDELQADNTRLLEERRVAVAKVEELQVACDSFHLGTGYADEPCPDCEAAKARREAKR